MKKAKIDFEKKVTENNSKDRYRKKSYTPPKKNIIKNEFTKILLSFIAKCDTRKELCNLLYEVGKNGAKLDVILATLHPQDIMNIIPKNIKKEHWLWNEISKKGIKQNNLMFFKNSKETNVIEVYRKKIKCWNNKKKSIKGAVKYIVNLEPIDATKFPHNYITNFNKKLKEIQQKVGDIFELYINNKESALFDEQNVRAIKGKRIDERELELNKKIKIITDELITIGYSQNTACKKTLKILKLSYPPYFNLSPDAVKQRFLSFQP